MNTSVYGEDENHICTLTVVIQICRNLIFVLMSCLVQPKSNLSNKPKVVLCVCMKTCSKWGILCCTAVRVDALYILAARPSCAYLH